MYSLRQSLFDLDATNRISFSRPGIMLEKQGEFIYTHTCTFHEKRKNKTENEWGNSKSSLILRLFIVLPIFLMCFA